MNSEKELFPCVAGPTEKNPSPDALYTLHAVAEYTFSIWTKNSTVKHNHDNYIEIMLVAKEKVNHVLNDDKQKLSVGSATILFPGDCHRVTSSPKSNAETVNITCYTATAEKLAKTLFNQSLAEKQSFTAKLSPKQMEMVSLYVAQILSLTDQQEADNAVASFFAFMLGALLAQKKNADTKNQHPKWLNNFLSALSELDFEYMKISDLYKLSTYSQSVLSVQFRKYMGMTLVQYVTNLKFEYACNLLTKTNFTVLYISNKIGFTSLSHFNKQFKQKYRLTPSDYRKKYFNNGQQ